MARKLTPAIVTQINRMRRDGATNAAIAAALNLSTGSVSQAARGLTGAQAPRAARHAPPAPVSTAPPPDPVSPEPLTTDELRALLSKLARELSADAERARNNDEAAAYMMHAKQAMAAVGALARLPIPREEQLEGATIVTDASIAEAAAKCRELLARYVGGSQ